MTLQVKIKRLSADAVIPKYAHESDAGFDLVATEDVILEPGDTKLVPTGLAFKLPEGYEMQVRPRSGISLKTKLRVSNSPGTIDSNYRGEVKVIIDNIFPKYFNNGMKITGATYFVDGTEATLYGENLHNTYIIRKGDRIGQAVIKPVEHAKFIEVGTLEETSRGADGFGSSGVTNA